MEEKYRLEELPKEEGDKLTKELQNVLAKYDAEMQVTSKIEILKRVPIKSESVISPIQLNDGDSGKETTEAH